MKNINFTLLIVAVTLLCTNTITAQVGDYPPNAEPGKCYAKCLIADQYETVIEQVLVKDATYRIESSAPVYETVEETYEIKPATTRIEVIPESRETITEEYEIEPASTRLEVTPAKYETIQEKVEIQAGGTRSVCTPMTYKTESEQIEVSPATTKWVRRKADRNCLSADPNDCLVWCLVEVPAKTEVVTRRIPNCPTGSTINGDKCCKQENTPPQFRTITKKVLKTPAKVREVQIPAKMGTLTRKVIKEPSRTREIEVPAEYGTRTRKVLKTPGLDRQIEIPAEYKTITKKVLVQTGGFSEWREVLCGSQMTTATVRAVQDALRNRGYDPGQTDNIMGQQTKAALVKFQKDNGLPIGNLDFETLRALGLNY